MRTKTTPPLLTAGLRRREKGGRIWDEGEGRAARGGGLWVVSAHERETTPVTRYPPDMRRVQDAFGSAPDRRRDSRAMKYVAAAEALTTTLLRTWAPASA